jgi:hypothetical protein
MKTITAEEFDRKFDDGEDISAYVDWSKGYHPNLEMLRIDVDLPQWLLSALDERAAKLGLTRDVLAQRLLEDALADEADHAVDGHRDVAE